jgi:spore germination protein YaaH
MHAQELILAMPPPIPAQGRGKTTVTPQQFRRLSMSVDGFSLMTYDWNMGQPGPNAPYYWVNDNLKFLVSAAK